MGHQSVKLKLDPLTTYHHRNLWLYHLCFGDHEMPQGPFLTEKLHTARTYQSVHPKESTSSTKKSPHLFLPDHPITEAPHALHSHAAFLPQQKLQKIKKHFNHFIQSGQKQGYSLDELCQIALQNADPATEPYIRYLIIQMHGALNTNYLYSSIAYNSNNPDQFKRLLFQEHQGKGPDVEPKLIQDLTSWRQWNKPRPR